MAKRRPIISCGKVHRKEVHEIHIFEFQPEDDSPRVIKACCLGYKEKSNDSS